MRFPPAGQSMSDRRGCRVRTQPPPRRFGRMHAEDLAATRKPPAIDRRCSRLRYRRGAATARTLLSMPGTICVSSTRSLRSSCGISSTAVAPSPGEISFATDEEKFETFSQQPISGLVETPLLPGHRWDAGRCSDEVDARSARSSGSI
jgi:hypothetical protein